MAHGISSVYTVTMASGATLTSELNLNRSWDKMFLVIQSMNSNSAILIQASDSSGGTYRRVKHPSINSSTVTTNDYTIVSAASSAFVPIPAGLRYIKVETTATVDNGCTFKVVCAD